MFKLSIVLLTAIALSSCATSRPHEQYPAKLPENARAGEYAAFSDAGEITHTCIVRSPNRLECRDHRTKESPEAPSGTLVQKGIRVDTVDTEVATSETSRPISATYDHQVRIARDALWLDDRKLVEGLAKLDNPDKPTPSLIQPLREAVEVLLRNAREAGKPEPRFIIVVDRLVPDRIRIAVHGTLLVAGVSSPEGQAYFAIVRARHRLHIACEPSPDARDTLTCRTVTAEASGMPSVRRIEWIGVGVERVDYPHEVILSGLPPEIQRSKMKDAIQRVIGEHGSEFVLCYDKELQKNRFLDGNIVVRFVVTPSGEVETASIRESTLNNESVESCVCNAIRTLVFPKSPIGEKTIVNYPFNFMGL